MSDDFGDWLRANPAPDLQDLVRRFGGYNKITPEAWAEFDRAMADWEARRRTHHLAAQGARRPRGALPLRHRWRLHAAAKGRRAGDLAM